MRAEVGHSQAKRSSAPIVPPIVAVAASAGGIQALLVLLESDRLAIRGLAHWHLQRLAPEGRAFGYDPLAPKEQRQAALKKWQQLIPLGKVPASGWTGGK